jgi:hypothetical protein
MWLNNPTVGETIHTQSSRPDGGNVGRFRTRKFLNRPKPTVCNPQRLYAGDTPIICKKSSHGKGPRKNPEAPMEAYVANHEVKPVVRYEIWIMGRMKSALRGAHPRPIRLRVDSAGVAG